MRLHQLLQPEELGVLGHGQKVVAPDHGVDAPLRVVEVAGRCHAFAEAGSDELLGVVVAPPLSRVEGPVHGPLELAADCAVSSPWIFGGQLHVDVARGFRIPVRAADVDVEELARRLPVGASSCGDGEENPHGLHGRRRGEPFRHPGAFELHGD